MTATTAPRLVGIDLGTTNSAVAWVDARAAAPGRPRLFEIPQLVAAGEIAARQVLPSFLYLPAPNEIETGAWSLPWDAEPDAVAGVHARDQGALVPARLVSSAKSWLSNPSVDRRAALLPWAHEPPRRLSPVDASTRLLAHLRDAWNHEQARDEADLRLERQTIVLTVPASFDEEARELTVEAARAAGFTDLTLIEEPLAALYAWMAAHRRDLAARRPHGQTILVCDVGGGTTDFSLFRADADDEGVRFERTAIGEHLLLGGDNVDLALAAAVERRIAGEGGPALTLTQRQALRRQCSAAKERLMADGGPEHVTIAVLGAGRGVVAGTRSADLTRTEVERVLDDFLPVCGRGDRPARERRHGLRELGLPYESDPAITKHLAAFLARAARAGAATDGDADMARPDAVLFNGGFFTPPRARDRILDALAEWFGERPAVLSNDRPEAAVAIGAAFFAGLRRNPEAARRLLVRAGSARTYYIGVQGAGAGAQSGALCIMPRGTQEGTRLAIDRTFTVTSNQPAAFTLYSSIERADPVGALITNRDDLHRHAPLVTALSYGKRSRRVPIEVGLSILFSEVGTLEIWCESRTSDHRWRLQFNLRGTDRQDADALDEQVDRETAEAEGQIGVDDEAVEAAEQLIRDVFASGAGGSAPDALVGALERALGHGKHAWPLPVIRRLADALLAAAEGRRASARHEARWLNLTGFCARPGFGTTLDPWRITQLRAIYAADLIYPREVQNQVEWLILWQRVAGGFTAAQQQELARKVSGLLGLGARKGPHLNPQVAREAWRLLGSLERLDAAQRAKFGNELAARVRRDPRNAALVWALGRLGARVPFHGPLNAVVPPAEAQRWMETLLTAKTITADIAAAVGQIGARTGDPARDIDDEARQAAIARLDAAAVPKDVWLPLREIVAPDRLDAVRTFGETLPEGLRVGEKELGVRS